MQTLAQYQTAIIKITCPNSPSPLLPTYWVHNEIHNVKMPSETLPSQVFQMVANSNQRAKGWQMPILFLAQTKKGIKKKT